MFDVIDMPWSWPVEVNHHEAKAFCAWHGEDYRLPVEAEHTVMRGTQVQHEYYSISTETFVLHTLHMHLVTGGCGYVPSFPFLLSNFRCGN